jgi:UDP-MurNAc hydroxylase
VTVPTGPMPVPAVVAEIAADLASGPGVLDAYGVAADPTRNVSTNVCGRPAISPPTKLDTAATPSRKGKVRVTSVGHAGFRIDTPAGSILCDPWVNPAYFASWFPFPDNSTLDWDALGEVDYLYVSHLHKDHFDPENLRDHVNKDAVVLLPDYPVPDLQRELEKLGFHRFFETTDSVKHRVSGPKGDLEVMIIALRAPADGPIGDSGLVVSDRVTTVFNMNDARPVDLDVLHADFGHVDVHMLQYSGAIWYPMVYEMPARAKEAFGTQKRQRQMDRCRQYIAQVGATWVIPSAGPPCFLDPELRDLNDDHGDPANIFPDQVVFLGQMRAHGHDRGLLMIPGSTADFTGPQLNSLIHPMPDDEVQAIFTTGKADYIAAYADGMAPVLAAEKQSWAPAAGESLLEPLRAKFEPLMTQSDQICDGIGYPVELRLGAETVVLDFPKRLVREPIPDEKFRYGFEISPDLVRTVLRDDEPDWVNTIFLSTRFKAWRVGGYNEYLYTFFKCLADDRIAYADGWFAEAHDDTASITLAGWEIQRRCPHLKVDLSKFGVVDGTTLTCNLHGWQWNLETGRCLTTKGHELRSAREETRDQ